MINQRYLVSMEIKKLGHQIVLPYNFLFVRGHSPAAIFLGHSESTE